jgi:NAD-dependent deacetylase
MMKLSNAELHAAARLGEWWHNARRVVVFTGAGMSTESGLPDFRSAGGLWKQHRRFEELASVEALTRWPEEFDEFYRFRIQQALSHAPHAGHHVLAHLERMGRVTSVITQNVDGYHESAGSRNVLRLHGTLRSTRCQRCKRAWSIEHYLGTHAAYCECGGKLRPEVVLFGEMLDRDVLQRAVEDAQACDLFVVLGSSLLVSPANTLPELALRAGARLVIINRDPTPLTSRADLTISASIGPTLEAVAKTFEPES